MNKNKLRELDFQVGIKNKRTWPSNHDNLDLIKLFSKTWSLLDSYDKDRAEFHKKSLSKKEVKITGIDLQNAIEELRINLIKKHQATELFAFEKRVDSIEGIVGNVFQSFGGHDVYQSLEDKASHLLYFIVKNHPFTDGNKRSGAFAFVWFLEKAKILDTTRINPEALTAITLMIAESNPRHMVQVVNLVVALLEK